ncbi:MAG: hypothetical protein ACYTF8_15530 [Planctomycetota bacterium]
MRWLILIILAVASFAAYLLWIHAGADALVAAERDVTVRLRALATETPREAREEHGYRFEWIEGQELPDVLVASPAEHGETGVRWFATVDGRAIYQYDPVLFRAPDNRPDLRALRRYLALEPDQRQHRPLPGGWQTAE